MTTGAKQNHRRGHLTAFTEQIKLGFVSLWGTALDPTAEQH